jgi:dolichol kinase
LNIPALAWIDWLVPILFFGLRDAPLVVAIACAFLMGLVLTLFSIDPIVELVTKSALISLLVLWLFPLIQWNHPKNAMVAWWGVLIVDGFASVILPQFLGHGGPEVGQAPDWTRLLATGILGSLFVGILYGSGQLNSSRLESGARRLGR